MKKTFAALLAGMMLLTAWGAVAEGKGEPMFATFGEAADAAGENGAVGGNNDYMAAVMEKDGKYYRSVTMLDDRAREMFRVWMEDDGETDDASIALNDYVFSLPVSYTEEFTTDAVPKSREELDALVGKTIRDLEEEGYTFAYAVDGENGGAVITLYSGMYNYDFTTAEEYEYDKFDKITVTGAKYSGISSFATDLRFHADGTVEDDALPPYYYTGEDPVEGAVAEYTAQDGENYLTEPGYVTIPCPVIIKTEQVDDTHVKVYGNFWIMNYVRDGQILKCISGGERLGIADLELADGEWRVVSIEEAGDGDDYGADMERFAGGDAELLEKYRAASSMDREICREARARFIRDYVAAYGLDITAYQDTGWDPVSLEGNGQ